MVEEIMVTEAISSRMIKVGREVLRRLEQSGLRINAALWLYSSEHNAWRLILATPTITVDGPKKTYQKIQSILLRPAILNIGIENIQVVDNQYPLINLLRNGLHSVSHMMKKRVSHTSINGYFIEDAYIYFLQGEEKKSGQC